MQRPATTIGAQEIAACVRGFVFFLDRSRSDEPKFILLYAPHGGASDDFIGCKLTTNSPVHDSEFRLRDIARPGEPSTVQPLNVCRITGPDLRGVKLFCAAAQLPDIDRLRVLLLPWVQIVVQAGGMGLSARERERITNAWQKWSDS